MKFKNASDLPAPFVRAVSEDGYERGDCDYTVTELLQPPRLHQLVKRHDAEIEVDVSERLWVLLGTVAHGILERAGKEGQELTERRLYASISGKTISGKPDTLALASGLLTDYKVTSVWKYILGPNPDWEAQLNSYAYLASKAGHTVKALEIFAMFRDWSPSKSQGSEDYPKTNCLRIPVPLWPTTQTIAFLSERIALHEAAKRAPDASLPLCTPEERWAKKDQWAVMKAGRKSALALLDAPPENVVAGTYIEKRPGKSTRCESYCSAAFKCSQWAQDSTNPANAKEEVAM